MSQNDFQSLDVFIFLYTIYYNVCPLWRINLLQSAVPRVGMIMKVSLTVCGKNIHHQ
jgi:hypothetical protein